MVSRKSNLLGLGQLFVTSFRYSFGGVRQSYVPSTSVDVQFVDQEPIVFTFKYRPMGLCYLFLH